MPFVSDIFEYTGGSAPGPAGTPISSAKRITRDDDLKSALNTTTSIARGGTNAISAVSAADNLSTVSSSIASATTTDLATATGVNVTITGTTTITGLGTVQTGARRNLLFGGALTLTHNGTSLILPTGANITTAAGDIFKFESLGSGNWRCVGYLLASGESLAIDIVGDLTPQLGGPLSTNAHALYWSKGSDVSSATSLALGIDGNSFDITGTTTITSIDTWAVGGVALIHFDGILTLTHHATNLILQGGANITTAVGDMAIIHEYASGDWRVMYFRADGTAIVGSSSFTLEYISPDQTITSAGTITLTHGLGVLPKTVVLDLICTTAEVGYSVGDVISMNTGFDTSSNRGVSIIKTSTELILRYRSEERRVGKECRSRWSPYH